MIPKAMDSDLNASNDSCNADSVMMPLEFNGNLVAKIEDYEKDENCMDDYLHQMDYNAYEEAHYSKDFTIDIPNGNIIKKDETESEDDDQPVSDNTEPHGENLLNSCILDEILSEKKKFSDFEWENIHKNAENPKRLLLGTMGSGDTFGITRGDTNSAAAFSTWKLVQKYAVLQNTPKPD